MTDPFDRMFSAEEEANLVDQSVSVEEMKRVDDEFVDQDYIANFESINNAVISIDDALRDIANREGWLGGLETECRAVDRSWRWETLPKGKKAIPSRIICTCTRKDDGHYVPNAPCPHFINTK